MCPKQRTPIKHQRLNRLCQTIFLNLIHILLDITKSNTSDHIIKSEQESIESCAIFENHLNLENKILDSYLNLKQVCMRTAEVLKKITKEHVNCHAKQ